MNQLYTTYLYYPSPVDGNNYETYVHDEYNYLQPVHIELNANDGLYYPYYLKYNSSYLPPEKVYIPINVNNGISNVCYYQPMHNGQRNILYCSTTVGDITFLINPNFGFFSPLTFLQNSQNTYIDKIPEQVFENKFVQRNPFEVPACTSYPKEIDQILSAVQSGELKSTTIDYQENGFKIRAIDNLGNVYCFEKIQNYGISQISSSVTNYSNNKNERLERVKALRFQNKTQDEIAKILNVSQKTISNDLKEIGIL